jgi:hypothetical protein
MSTVAEVKALVTAHFPAPANIAYGSWTAASAVNGVPMPGWVQCWCVVHEFSGANVTRTHSFRLVASGTGADTDTCYVNGVNLNPVESNVAKLQRLIYERIATQCAPGTGAWLSAHIDWLEPCEACPTAQVTIRLRSDSSEKVAAVGLDAAGTGLEVTVLT